MSTLALLILAMLFARGSHHSTSDDTPTHHPTGDIPIPDDYVRPTPAHTDTPLTPTTPAAPSKSAVQKVQWAQSVPKDLPKFPDGWEPANPPTKSQQARAWALLKPLWKKGKGALVSEKTDGEWITYQAFVPKKGMKGVSVWRVKAGLRGGALDA